MNNTLAGAAIPPRAPVNSALTNSLEQLMRCENLAQSIHARIHPAQPTEANNADKPYLPSTASELSNTLSSRLSALGDLLSDIDASF